MLAIPKLMNVLCVTFFSFGFIINWKPGKTECFTILRGKHSAAELAKIRNNEMTIPLPSACESASLRLVQDYKHLGSWLSRNPSAAPDVSHRIASAMSVYCPLSFKRFGSCRIHRDIRMRLFSSLVIPRLLYKVNVWSVLRRSAYAKLNAVYMKGLRRIAGMMRFKSTGHGSDEQVRSPRVTALMSKFAVN